MKVSKASSIFIVVAIITSFACDVSDRRILGKAKSEFSKGIKLVLKVNERLRVKAIDEAITDVMKAADEFNANARLLTPANVPTGVSMLQLTRYLEALDANVDRLEAAGSRHIATPDAWAEFNRGLAHLREGIFAAYHVLGG